MQHAPEPVVTIQGKLMRKKTFPDTNEHYTYNAKVGHDEKMRLMTSAHKNYAPSAEAALQNQKTLPNEQIAIQNNVRSQLDAFLSDSQQPHSPSRQRATQPFLYDYVKSPLKSTQKTFSPIPPFANNQTLTSHLNQNSQPTEYSLKQSNMNYSPTGSSYFNRAQQQIPTILQYTGAQEAKNILKQNQGDFYQARKEYVQANGINQVPHSNHYNQIMQGQNGQIQAPSSRAYTSMEQQQSFKPIPQTTTTNHQYEARSRNGNNLSTLASPQRATDFNVTRDLSPEPTPSFKQPQSQAQTVWDHVPKQSTSTLGERRQTLGQPSPLLGVSSHILGGYKDPRHESGIHSYNIMQQLQPTNIHNGSIAKLSQAQQNEAFGQGQTMMGGSRNSQSPNQQQYQSIRVGDTNQNFNVTGATGVNMNNTNSLNTGTISQTRASQAATRMHSPGPYKKRNINESSGLPNYNPEPHKFKNMFNNDAHGMQVKQDLKEVSRNYKAALDEQRQRKLAGDSNPANLEAQYRAQGKGPNLNEPISHQQRMKLENTLKNTNPSIRSQILQ